MSTRRSGRSRSQSRSRRDEGEAGSEPESAPSPSPEHFLGPGARHPDKGEGWPKPVEVLEKHLGYRVDLQRGEFQLPPPTMKRVAKMAKSILRSQARHARWVGALWIAEFAVRIITS